MSHYIERARMDQAGRIVVPADRRAPEGLVYNPPDEFQRPNWITSDPVSVALAAQGVAGDTAELKFTITQEGHYDWTHMVGTATGLATAEFFDPGRNTWLQNRPVPLANCVSTALRPFRLPEPYFFNVGDARRELICLVRNFTAQANTIRLALWGRRYYENKATVQSALVMAGAFKGCWRTHSYFLQPKEQPVGGIPPAIAGLGSTTFTFEADSNADSDIHSLMVTATGAFEFTLREALSNRVLSNNPMHSRFGFGTAEFPYYFADTELLERSKALIMLVTDLSGSQKRVIPTLAGRRLEQ